MSMTYHEQLDRKNTLKLRELQAELPAFAGRFFPRYGDQKGNQYPSELCL